MEHYKKRDQNHKWGMLDKKCLNVTNDSLTPKEEGVGKGVSNFTQTTEFQLYVLYPDNKFIYHKYYKVQRL